MISGIHKSNPSNSGGNNNNGGTIWITVPYNPNNPLTFSNTGFQGGGGGVSIAGSGLGPIEPQMDLEETKNTTKIKDSIVYEYVDCDSALLQTADSVGKELKAVRNVNNKLDSIYTHVVNGGLFEKGLTYGRNFRSGNKIETSEIYNGSEIGVGMIITPTGIESNSVHCHTLEAYPYPDIADIYVPMSLVDTIFNENDYKGYILAADSSVFCYVVTNPVKAQEFIAKYPYDANIDPSAGKQDFYTSKSKLKYIEKSFYSKAIKRGMNDNDARAFGMANMLNKMDMGVGLFKAKNIDSKFEPVLAKQNLDKTKSINFLYIIKCN